MLAPFGSSGLTAAPAGVATAAASTNSQGMAAASTGGLKIIREEDLPRCVNCKTCYQQVPELFEKATIVVDGKAMEVGRMIPGVLEHIQVTPELIARVDRVAANCDSEILR